MQNSYCGHRNFDSVTRLINICVLIQDKGFPKEEKSRLSPANVASQSSSTNESTRARNPESKSPVQPIHAGAYLGFMPATNLPANHALSNNYEQAMHAMQGTTSLL
jgi:hypothetical protein